VDSGSVSEFARALALRPKFIVADEPVSALDVSVGAQVVNLLQRLQCEFGLTYLFISHSMPVVRYLSTRIAVMYRGKIVEIGSTEQITSRPQHEYTRKLLAAYAGDGGVVSVVKDSEWLVSPPKPGFTHGILIRTAKM